MDVSSNPLVPADKPRHIKDQEEEDRITRLVREAKERRKKEEEEERKR
jgi:hypothetical protein